MDFGGTRGRKGGDHEKKPAGGIEEVKQRMRMKERERDLRKGRGT